MRHWVLIESNTTGSGAIAIRLLRDRGDDVTFVTRDRSKYPFLDGIRVLDADTNDVASLVPLVDRLAPDALVTFSTFYVTTVAELASRLRLRFLSPHAAATCHDKIASRRALKAAGLPGPRYWEVSSATDAAAAAAEVKYPCVMKPPTSSGSTGVLRVGDSRQLCDHYERLTVSCVNERGQAQSATVLVEDLLDGPEYSVESVTLAPGQTRIIGVTRKHLSTPPWFVELGHDFPAAVSHIERRAIEECVQEGLAAVGYDFGPAHTELKYTSSGPVIVEINPRLAGGMIPELVRLAYGVDLIDAYLRMLAGNTPQLDPTRHEQASIRFVTAPQPGTLRSLPDCSDLCARPGVAALALTAKPGRVVQPPQSAEDRLGYVIGNQPDLCDSVLREVIGRLDIR